MGAWLAPDTNTRVNNETWRRELCQYLEAAGGGGVLIEGDDAVLRRRDEVVEIGRLQHRREPARRHRRPARRHPQSVPGLLGVVFSASEITEINPRWVAWERAAAAGGDAGLAV